MACDCEVMVPYTWPICGWDTSCSALNCKAKSYKKEGIVARNYKYPEWKLGIGIDKASSVVLYPDGNFIDIFVGKTKNF